MAAAVSLELTLHHASAAEGKETHTPSSITLKLLMNIFTYRSLKHSIFKKTLHCIPAVFRLFDSRSLLHNNIQKLNTMLHLL